MTYLGFQSAKEMFSRTTTPLADLYEASKPYLLAVLIVAILLFLWIGLSAT